MTIGEAYKKGIQILSDAGIESPAGEAGALLCFVMGFDRIAIYTKETDTIGECLSDEYSSLLLRRKKGTPLQYLIGKKEFMSLLFEVNPGVLIPRNETELLVETVIGLLYHRQNKRRIRPCPAAILDIGTGCGCVAVSLAFHLPESSITAVDISPEALAVARRNAENNRVADRIRFVRSNLFEGMIKGKNEGAAVGENGGPAIGGYDGMAGEKFDVIVSNPPYIRTSDIEKLQDEIKHHEPLVALDGGPDGLSFYREIISKGSGFLKSGGMMVFETGYDQAAEVAGIMCSQASLFKQIRIFKDIAGIDRVVAGIS